MNNPISDGWPWPEAVKYISPISAFDPPSLFAKAISEIDINNPANIRLLDIGCGSGIVGIYWLVEQKAQFVTFNDIQDIAMLETRANVEKQIRSGTIQESQVSGHKGPFSSIPSKIIARHNLILFNPPQLPTDSLSRDYMDKLESNTLMRCFRSGGTDGLNIAREFFAWYAALKDTKPDAVVLLSSFLGKAQITKAIEKHHLTWKMSAKRVPLRAILNEQADKLDEMERINRSLQRNPPNDPSGKWSKELLTIQLTGTSLTGASFTNFPPNASSSIPGAIAGFNEAVRKFKAGLITVDCSDFGQSKPQVKHVADSPFLQQYLKGALENMETGRRAVQEKAKFIIPTVFGTFVASGTIATYGLNKVAELPVFCTCLVMAFAISVISILVSVSLTAVVEATFEFYVSAVIHAAIVFKSIDLKHPWCDLVETYARSIDNDMPNKNANDIRKTFYSRVKWASRLALCESHEYEQKKLGDKESEIYAWSRRVLEKWKSCKGNLLWSYSEILGYGIVAHFLFVSVIIFSLAAVLSNWFGLQTILVGR